MGLKKYFNDHKGLGVLSTGDKTGRINSAVYAKPHVIDRERVAFIMADRLTRSNLEENPYALYLFKEDGPGYKGKRLYLKKQGEFRQEKFVHKVCEIAYQSPFCSAEYLKGAYLCSFTVEKVLPLVMSKK